MKISLRWKLMMERYFVKLLLTSLIIFSLIGCVSTSGINQGFRKIDRMWALEYQKTEDKFRYRVVEAPYDLVYSQVKKTFLDLNMPLIIREYQKGLLVAENEAPNPLTQEEWLKVKEVESPKTRAEAGWMFYLPDDPSDYQITVEARLVDKGSKTFILLDYKMSNPMYEEMGLKPSEFAPPLAVQLGSVKFWDTLSVNLNSVSLPSPRKREKNELYAIFKPIYTNLKALFLIS